MLLELLRRLAKVLKGPLKLLMRPRAGAAPSASKSGWGGSLCLQVGLFIALALLQVFGTAAGEISSRSTGCLLQPFDLAAEAGGFRHRDVDFVGTPKPRLSWKLRALASDDALLNARQTAYRITAAVGTYDAWAPAAWDSGWVTSDQSVGIVWDGMPLASDTSVSWTVRIRDAVGAECSALGRSGLFHVGLLRPQDWQGDWIVHSNTPPSTDCAFYSPSPPPLMRTEFELPKPSSSDPDTSAAIRATVHVVGLGYSQLWINGARAGDAELDPALTSYNRTVLYSSWDVTDLLRPGANAIGIEVGHGWFNPLPFNLFGKVHLRSTMTVGPPRALLQLNIQLPDGTTINVQTGRHWKCAAVGPRTHSNIYLGEAFDARLTSIVEGWNVPGFDANSSVGWSSCMIADDSDVVVENSTGSWQPPQPVLQFAPPVRVTARWTAQAGWWLPDGSFVLDFGQELTGWLDMAVTGAKEGTEISIVFAERLNTSSTSLQRADIDATSTFAGGMGRWCAPGSGCESEWGECVFHFPPKGRCSGEQAFTYTASGKEAHVPGEGVRSAFSFHVFRYARVRGWPLPTPADRHGNHTASDSSIPLHRFTAMRLHTDNAPAARDPPGARETIAGCPPVPTEPSFRASSVLLNEIDTLAAAAFRSNWIGIQSDCPGRERLGYGGDMMVSAEAGLYMFDSAKFYAKRAQDYVDARRSNGGLPETAPFVGIATCDTLNGHAGAGPMQWGATLPHTLQLLHMHANDTTTLRKHFHAAVEWMDLLEKSRQPNGVLVNGLVGFVDAKAQGGVCGPAFTALMGTAFLFQQCTIMARLAQAMGDEDALVFKYQSLANETAAAFNEQFFNPETATYGNATDDEQVYALGLGLVPNERVSAMLAGLLGRVRARGGAFVVDAFGVWLLQNLVPLGAGEAVMNWMLSEEYPRYELRFRICIHLSTVMCVATNSLSVILLCFAIATVTLFGTSW